MRNWYEIDNLRETWCILSFQVDDLDSFRLTQWELGVGNMNQLVYTEAVTTEENSTSTERCKRLCQELERHRHSSRLLITGHRRALEQLRRLLFSCPQLENATLRGFRHVGLDDILSEYFGEADIESIAPRLPDTEQSRANVDPDYHSVLTLWNLWTEIAPLLPASIVIGREL